MSATQVGQHVFIAVGKFLSVTRIAAGFELCVLSIHISLNRGDVSDQIGEGEFPLLISPIHPFRRYTVNYLQGALAYFFIVVQERTHRPYFHSSPHRVPRHSLSQFVSTSKAISVITSVARRAESGRLAFQPHSLYRKREQG